MGEVKYWQAINNALREEMHRDASVVLLGEDVGRPGGAFGATKGLLDMFGSVRVRDTPISELAITGLGVGAALMGLRPVVEVMFSDFLTLAMDQLVNQAAKLHFMSGGDACVPLVVRTMVGAGRGTGPQHGQSLEAWFCHVPGLKVVAPSTPRDARGLLKSAIRDNNPVVVFESLALWGTKGDISTEDDLIPIGRADVRIMGSDVTLVSYGGAMARAVEATRLLAAEDVSAELIDLRSLQPLDLDTIRFSVEKTGRMVIAHDAVRFLGLGAEIAASIAEQCHGALKAPIARVAAPFSPVPFAPVLEKEYFPQASAIVDAAKKLVRS